MTTAAGFNDQKCVCIGLNEHLEVELSSLWVTDDGSCKPCCAGALAGCVHRDRSLHHHSDCIQLEV